MDFVKSRIHLQWILAHYVISPFPHATATLGRVRDYGDGGARRRREIGTSLDVWITEFTVDFYI